MNNANELQPARQPPTRREAMRRASRFYRGRPCPIHGDVLRYTTSSGCRECQIASAIATKQRERELRSAELDIDEEET